MLSHAAVPVCYRIGGDVYRVFFSTRDAQQRSSTYSATFSLSKPQEVLEVGEQPVVGPGSPGSFDDAGAMATAILKVGTDLLLYYIGWNRGVSVPFRNSIGLAVSRDGGTAFEKLHPGPILDRSQFDPCFTASCHVLEREGGYTMWYLSGLRWERDEIGNFKHFYHIKTAESPDAKVWQRTGQVAIDFKDDSEHAISVPRVIKTGAGYSMWYSYRGDRYRIGYAESVDGLSWSRMDDLIELAPSIEDWDSEMICYPFVFEHGSDLFMLYNGNSYGKTGFGLARLQR